MTFEPRKALPHSVSSWACPGSLYFFTQCLEDRTRTDLIQPDTAQALLAAARHYHERLLWFMPLFLLMPDHLHTLVAFPVDQAMQDVWQNWKRYTAKETSVVWQRDFFEHRLRPGESLHSKGRYIRENPVRKGLVSEAGQWPWIFEP